MYKSTVLLLGYPKITYGRGADLVPIRFEGTWEPAACPPDRLYLIDPLHQHQENMAGTLICRILGLILAAHLQLVWKAWGLQGLVLGRLVHVLLFIRP